MSGFETAVDFVNSLVWSPALIALLLAAGLYFTVRTRFVQIRRLPLMVKLLFARKHQSGVEGVSSFQAFCLALSGRVGTGNIVGVATAIVLGGPGSVFWMWVIAFIGASTAFVESTLSQIYKFQHSKGWRGGPACYIEKGLGQRWLGVIFAILTVIGYGILLTTVQCNGVAGAFSNSFGMPKLWVGAGLVVFLFLVTIGGLKRLAQVASVLTPFMAITYVILSLIVIAVHIEDVPGAFKLIFQGAFGAGPVWGGMVGSAISMGIKRGLFSNEAGEGGGAIVSASADVDQSAKQGLVQAFSVYIDTLLVCTATALMIICTGLYNVFDASGNVVFEGAPRLGDNYVAYTQAAIDSVFTGWGSSFVAIALAFFAFTTLMAYYFYAESSLSYLFETGRRKNPRMEKVAIWIYRILLFSAVVFGACTEAATVWKIGDIGVGITTWVNVIALLILCPQAIKALRELES